MGTSYNTQDRNPNYPEQRHPTPLTRQVSQKQLRFWEGQDWEDLDRDDGVKTRQKYISNLSNSGLS